MLAKYMLENTELDEIIIDEEMLLTIGATEGVTTQDGERTTVSSLTSRPGGRLSEEQEVQIELAKHLIVESNAMMDSKRKRRNNRLNQTQEIVLKRRKILK